MRMSVIDKLIEKIDNFQQRYRFPGFVYAVIKKYGDDHAGYQAALLTYYGFLSIFPLLLVLTTIAGMVASRNPELQANIIESMTDYFPVLGSQLSETIGSLHKGGLALVIGLLFTLYGARGVADAFQHGIHHIWHIPYEKRPGFPQSTVKSIILVIIGGLGMLAASVSSSVAAAAGHGPLFYILSALVNLLVLFWVFVLILNLCLPKHVPLAELRSGAITAAIGLVVLQSLGGYILTQQLKNLDALYSNFAIPLGLLFWIYLQAQVLYYAIEIANVRSRNLWPRSLSGKTLTAADKAAYSGQAKKEKVVKPERINTSFKKQ
jgi:membrane protein